MCNITRLYRVWKVEIVFVEINWNKIEYPALSNPKITPKIHKIIALNTNTCIQISRPFLLAKYKAIKSVPPEEAPAFKASTILIPQIYPPNTTFKTCSSNNG